MPKSTSRVNPPDLCNSGAIREVMTSSQRWLTAVMSGERAVVLLFIARVLCSLPLSLLPHGLSLSLLSLFAFFIEIRADNSPFLFPFKTRPGASSGIMLGAVTLPTVMLSKLIQLSRAFSLQQIDLEELEHTTMQYWTTSACCFAVLVFLCLVMWFPHNSAHPRCFYSSWDAKFSLICFLLYGAICCVSLATISQTSVNTALKSLWLLCHGFAAVKLIHHLLETFPSCASMGEALLATSGLVLYFGDMLACTIAKFFGLMVPTDIISIQYGVKRNEISIFTQQNCWRRRFDEETL